jgi:hypothetical protein
MAEQVCGHQVPHRKVQGRNGPWHDMCLREKPGNAKVFGLRWTGWPATIRQAAMDGQKTGEQKNIRYAKITGRGKPHATGLEDREEPA